MHQLADYKEIIKFIKHLADFFSFQISILLLVVPLLRQIDDLVIWRDRCCCEFYQSKVAVGFFGFLWLWKFWRFIIQSTPAVFFCTCSEVPWCANF